MKRDTEMIAVVIPCYKTRNQVLPVIEKIGPEVSNIYVIDDFCPEGTGDYVLEKCRDPRIIVIKHDRNLGVGGAMVTGYRRALADGATIVVKIDGDGQMNPELIHTLIEPIIDGQADYTKGNRFHALEYLANMPGVRLFGNAFLSLITKFSTGYWDIMDPTNGFTAIHGKVLRILPLEKLNKRYFFETDMLFRLNISRAVIRDIPLVATYNNGPSSLKITSTAIQFPWEHLVRFSKRIFYSYFLREFNMGTVQLTSGALLMGGGAVFGAYEWIKNAQLGVETTSGTVMIAALPILLGFNLLLGAVNYDIASTPRNVLHKVL